MTIHVMEDDPSAKAKAKDADKGKAKDDDEEADDEAPNWAETISWSCQEGVLSIGTDVRLHQGPDRPRRGARQFLAASAVL